MKKTISILMVLFLIFSTISPFPIESADAEADFQGNITGSTVGENNLSTIKVKMNEITGTTWSIRLIKEYGSFDQFEAHNGGEHEFKDVPPGAYKIEATAKDTQGSTMIQTSKVYYVKPKAITSTEINKSQPNQISVTLNDAISGTLIRLYIDNTQVPPNNGGEKTIDNINKTVLFSVDARSNYRLTQVVNGEESDKSDFIKVIPQIPTLRVDSHAGPSNNAGILTVSGTKKDNKLILYRGGIAVYPEPIRVDSTTYTFENLPSGTYTVKQIENDVDSEVSNAVIINNEQSPILTLNNPNENNYAYTLKDGNIIAEPYQEHGVFVSYRSIKEQKVTQSGQKFCESIENDPRCVIVTIKYEPEITTYPNIGPLPGKYKVIYTATDDKEEKYTSSIIRNVTIFPNAVEIKSLNTKEFNGTKPIEEHTTGGINVNNGVLTMPDSIKYPTTLTLYQDPSGSNSLNDAILIKSETFVGEDSHIFDNVPLGKGYFVVQTINGVSGKPSNWVNITDTTSPEMVLNGNNPITLEVGESYIEPGVTAIDNVDSSESLLRKVRIKYFAPSKEKPGGLTEFSTINTNIPNIYTVKYNLTDESGNHATELIRTVYVKPRAVTAIGSIATIGEVGVKNIFPGTPLQETHLQLWRYNTDKKIFEIDGDVVKLVSSELTHVFKKYDPVEKVFKPLPPGRYYVTQTVNGQTSKPSNVVEIVDIDRPYITLNGLETIELILGETLEPFYDGEKLTDPGAKADDYLEAACLMPNDPKTCLKLTATLTDGKGNTIGTPIQAYGKNISLAPVILEIPDIYKITYSAVANRGSKADEKYRIIKLSPPKVTGVSSGEPGEGKIIIKDGLLKHTSTTVTLYNTYNQKIDSQVVNNEKNAEFKGVPAGLGYYVTQTVNGIESAPSKPVNVSLYSAEPLITSFEFSSLKAVGIIDHVEKTINVTVPKGTNRTSLKPTIKGIGNISPLSDVAQNFTSSVKYTVTSGKAKKEYTVIVSEASVNTDRWEDAVLRNVTLSTSNTFTLTSLERYTAAQRGISFVSSELSIYVPASIVKESQNPTLSIERPKPSTLYASTDPSWKTTISNPLQISWGNDSSFYQPMEVELTKEDNKVFVKLVRNAKRELMAIVQPSYASDKKIIGLVSEPGLYALIEDVGNPHIQNLGNGRYQIYALKAGLDIYYTTDSKDITYEKPATSPTGNYVLNTTNLSLGEWNSYEEGETLTIPNNELYAVAVKDQIISPVSAAQPTAYTSWGNGVKEERPDKIWVISFNAQVDRRTLYNNAIYVVDDTTGAIVPTTLEVSTDGTSIHVIPTTPYVKQKQYTLWVTRQIKSNAVNSQFLEQTIKQSFIIK